MESSKLLKPINTVRNGNVADTMSEDEEPLTPNARMFHTPQLNCLVIAIMGCKTNINVNVIKQGLMHTLVKHPRFSSKLVLDPKKGDQPTGWTRTEVNIDDHVIVPDLDPNTDSPDQFLEDYVSNLTTTPMDLTKPLWEIHILNIKTKEANSVSVFRIHHSIGDGASLISTVLACTRQTANPDALPTLPTASSNKMMTSPSSSLGVLSWFLGLMFIFKLLWNTLIDLAMFTATTFWLKDTKTPIKGGPGIELTPKRFFYKTFSLDDIKLVKKALDVTINDVLLGITQAGLSHYLNRKYGEIKGEGKAKEDNLPKHIRFRSSVIVNLRPASTIKNLAEKMEASSKGKWNSGNAIGYVFLPLDIALRDDPLDYIRNANATMERKKHSLEALCAYKITRIVINTLGLQAVVALTYRVISHPSLIFSNVVGPKEEISFFGHPIAFIAPSAFGLPQALIVHFQSYMDKMTVVLAIDEDVIPDPQRLCDDIEESLRLAYKAIIEQKLIF